MGEAEEDRIRGFLLTFVDFLYAVLFGVILQQVYSNVIFATSLNLSAKIVRILLVAGVFYFLLGDWIQGRLLTLRNPYKSYKRFFVEIWIAFAGYGAALEVLRADIFFVLYVMLALFLGAYWAYSTLKELTSERDKRELRIIIGVQVMTAFVGGGASFLWYWYFGQLISFSGVAMLYLIGWLYDLSYELLAPSRVGLEDGPGVPFLSRESVNKLRGFLRIPV